jgi:hypothetical protein
MAMIAFDQTFQLAKLGLVVSRGAAVHETIQNLVRASSHNLNRHILKQAPLGARMGKQERGVYADTLLLPLSARRKELGKPLRGLLDLETRRPSCFVGDAAPLALHSPTAAVQLLVPPFVAVAANAPVLMLALHRDERLRTQKEMIDLTRAVLVAAKQDPLIAKPRGEPIDYALLAFDPGFELRFTGSWLIARGRGRRWPSFLGAPQPRFVAKPAPPAMLGASPVALGSQIAQPLLVRSERDAIFVLHTGELGHHWGLKFAKFLSRMVG